MRPMRPRIFLLVLLVSLGTVVGLLFWGTRSALLMSRDRVHALHSSERWLDSLREALRREDCRALLGPVHWAAAMDPVPLSLSGFSPWGAKVDRVELIPSQVIGDTIYGRMTVWLKHEARQREVMVAYLRLRRGADGFVQECQAQVGVESGRTCPADNSPNARWGGPADQVQAPHGTRVLSGPLARQVFASGERVKWLPSGDQCGPVNECIDGQWTTVQWVECSQRR